MGRHAIAMVFDFDDTLVDDSTTALLEYKGIDANDFWKRRLKRLVENGWDPVHGYIKLLLDETHEGGPLYGLTTKELRQFGARLKPYPGVTRFFGDLRSEVAKLFPHLDLEVRFYIVSSGLEDLVRGCDSISRHMTGIYGCRLTGDSEDGPLKYIKRTVSFTEKTRYLFEINKGLRQADTECNPFLVNKHVADDKRTVPFSNMIYVGDGLTDIPCFSLVGKNGGAAFGILKRDATGNPKRELFDALVIEKRVHSVHSPNYGRKSDLGAMLRTAVISVCTKIDLRERQAVT